MQSKVKQVRLVRKLGKKGFHYDTKELFEPICKAATDTTEIMHEDSKSTTRAIEEMNESIVHVKDLKLRNRNGEQDTSLIRTIASPTVLVRQNKR